MPGREVTPNEAVEAADAAYRATVPTGDGSYQARAMRAALEAAAPHMPSSPISATEIEAVADMVKAAKADGWDEGANADHDFDGEVTTPNPYRPTQ